MAFDYQPSLNGRLLNLRPLQKTDYPELYRAASDPLIWAQHPNQDRHRESVFKGYFREALNSGGALIAIETKHNRIIGTSRYHGYDAKKNEVEIGWSFLVRSYWGGVFNGEMKQLMLKHAYGFVDTVIFRIGSDNIRSQRAAEKIGGILMAPQPNDEGGNVLYELSKATFDGHLPTNH